MDVVTLGAARAATKKASPTFGFASPSERSRFMPTFAKSQNNPVFSAAQSAFATAYWLWPMKMMGLLPNPLDNYYFWYSTNHDTGQGGIGLATAPTPEGPFTDHGMVFQDLVSGGIQAETPSVLYLPRLDPAKPFFMYYQKALVPGTVEQSTFLAKSADGVSWTVVGVVLTALNNTEVMGSGELTYLHPMDFGNQLVGYHVYGGGDYGHMGISYSIDGTTWTTDRRQLTDGPEWFDVTGGRTIGWNSGTVFQWKGQLWWIGLLANHASGSATKDNRIAIAPISTDLRRFTSAPTIVLPMTEAWESYDLQSLTYLADGGDLYVYYQCADKFGVAVARGV
jgi:hypothetical protein